MAVCNILIATSGNDSAQMPNEAELNSTPASAIAPQAAVQTVGARNTARTMGASVFAHQLIGAGIGAAKSVFNYAKANYGNFTGDYLGQTKIDNVFNIASNIISYGSTIASGALSGATFGPVGVVAGAAVGAVVGGVQIGITFAQNMVTQSLNMSKANNLANYNSQRIGAILVNGNR